MISGRSRVVSRPGGASITAGIALTRRIAVVFRPAVLWSSAVFGCVSVGAEITTSVPASANATAVAAPVPRLRYLPQRSGSGQRLSKKRNMF